MTEIMFFVEAKRELNGLKMEKVDSFEIMFKYAMRVTSRRVHRFIEYVLEGIHKISSMCFEEILLMFQHMKNFFETQVV